MVDELHPQDRILIIKALARYAGAPDEADTARQQRAWELIDHIGADLSLPVSEAIRQSDTRYQRRS
jgi:hypothetical protein